MRNTPRGPGRELSLAGGVWSSHLPELPHARRMGLGPDCPHFPKHLQGIFRVEGSATCLEVSLFYPAVVGVLSSPGKEEQSHLAKIHLSSRPFVHGSVPLQITPPLLSPAVTHITSASLNLTAKPLEVI